MLSNLLQRAFTQYSHEKPFVLYQKPNENVVHGIFQKNDDLYTAEDFTVSGFVFAPFDASLPRVLIPFDERMLAPIGYQRISKSQEERSEAVHLEMPSAKEFHIQLVEKGIRNIKADLFKKVVLSRKLELDTEGTPLDTFERLLDTYPSAFCYIWYHPKVGLWLGATPELLLNLNNQRLSTMSLAGTQAVRNNLEPEWNQKEIVEQQYVTEYITKSLASKVEHLEVSEPASLKAGKLWHLCTYISGRTEPSRLASIIKELHPTPAVCGLPKLPAKKFIQLHENYDRSYYTGFLGILNDKERVERSKTRRNQEHKAYAAVTNSTSLYVNLRCMQWKGEKIWVYVGGGITADSVPESEWEETSNKSATMLNILQKK